MNNIYYYTFYQFMRFFNWIRPSDLDNPFTGIAALSVPMALNVFSIVMVLEKTLILKTNTYYVSLIVILPILAMNYFLLYKKSELIKNYYDEKYKIRKYNILKITFIFLYVAISFAVAGYIAYLKRNHKI